MWVQRSSGESCLEKPVNVAEAELAKGIGKEIREDGVSVILGVLFNL